MSVFGERFRKIRLTVYQVIRTDVAKVTMAHQDSKECPAFGDGIVGHNCFSSRAIGKYNARHFRYDLNLH